MCTRGYVWQLTAFHPSERINSAGTLGNCSNSAALAAEISAKTHTKVSRANTIITTSEVELTTNPSINYWFIYCSNTSGYARPNGFTYLINP